MSRKVTIACLAWFAAAPAACLDVTPTPPSAAFEAMIAAANDGDGGEDAGLGSDGSDARDDDGGAEDSSVE
jgi:hypothetical protein